VLASRGVDRLTFVRDSLESPSLSFWVIWPPTKPFAVTNLIPELMMLPKPQWWRFGLSLDHTHHLIVCYQHR
jgi:hypothetical protein